MTSDEKFKILSLLQEHDEYQEKYNEILLNDDDIKDSYSY
jgi:hypothetical protein